MTYSPSKLRSRLLAIAMLFTLFAAACGGSGFDSATTASSDAGSSQEAPAAWDGDDSEAFEIDAAYEAESAVTGDIADEANRTSVTGAAGTEATSQLPDLGRDIIFTARLELGATDVSDATRQAIQAIEGRGGFLFSQDTSGGRSVLTFKVLPDQFQAALNDLGSVGDVRSQSISADDVSAVVVDLESRINTAEASVVRLRDLLDDASELETIATLENQLLQRETTLEQLRGQLRTVRSQVDLATITVTVTELLNRPGLAVNTMAYAGHDAGFGCFDSGNVRSGEVGDPITICYQVTNTGDTPLIDLAIDDPALGADLGSVIVVDGSVAEIEPGESIVLAHEVELEEPVRVRTSVTATGLDTDGNPIEDEVKATAPTLRFDVLNLDEGFPSFGEVLSDSWNALVTVAIVIALIAVAIAPFLAVGLILGYPLWVLVRRRRAARPTPPPPPAPPAPPTPMAPEASDPADPASAEEATTTV